MYIVLTFCLLFLFRPVLGTVFFILFRMLYTKKNENLDNLLFLFITVCVCLIQSARLWDIYAITDWTLYKELFIEVKGKSFYSYMTGGVKEPLWRFLNFIGYYLYQGSYFPFIKTISIITLCITSCAIYKYWKFINKSILVLICMFAFFFFFTEYWSQLNNILRQMFAMSLITYAIVYRCIYYRNIWWIIIAACLIHTFCFIYLFLILLSPLYDKIKKKEAVLMVVIFIIIALLLKYVSVFSQIFSAISFISYGFDRLATATDPQDQNFLDKTSVYLTSLFIICICYIKMYIFPVEKKNIFFTNLLAVIMLLCILLADYMREIMSRIYVSRFYLFPFVLPMLRVRSKVLTDLYLVFVILFFTIRFFIKFETIRGGFCFPPLSEIINSNIVEFFL